MYSLKTFLKLFIVLISIFFFIESITSNVNSDNNLIFKNERNFLSLRQLTISGENAEAYFSADGTELIFQSHKEDSLCDQIYIMNLKTLETRMVSTGKGVTTCSYFEYPECENIIYASTHLDNVNCPSKPDYSKGYVWKLYPGYDIFKSNREGNNLKRLTNSPNYDAEATYAHDGSKIIYTSMASGDLEIWTMNADGSGKKQLTDRLGYDGGAFFNHDASKIVWRVFHPESEKEIEDYKQLLKENQIRPMALQIWVMDSDGSNKRQITFNKSANFGPYFFPDGKKIIFSSNYHDPSGRNFDLYSINIDGTNMKRITFFDGFDGFPMFSPDGKYLVFASNRNQLKKGDTNLFIAEWKK